jgi:membrane protein DedA with SNARE-associated domain
MDLLHLITLFGYPMILAGTFIEGEMILILGGFAAHRGYLELPLVVFCAFCGAFMGDQFFFYLGRYRSRLFLERHPNWHSRISTVEHYIDRFRTLFVLGFRFVYGLRTVSPFVLGMGDIRPIVFIVLDAVSVLAWAILVGWLGYAFGNVMEMILGEIEHYEMELFALILITGLTVRMIQAYRKRRAVSSA